MKIAFLTHWTIGRNVAIEWKKRFKYADTNIEYWDLLDNPTSPPDAWVIYNCPRFGSETHPLSRKYDPSRTIVLQMEPTPEHFWPQLNDIKHLFLKVYSHATHPNTIEWHLSLSTDQIDVPIQKTKQNQLSAILSSKQSYPGHIKRTSFVKYIETHHPDIHVDVFGENAFDYKHFKGSLPPGEKDDGMMPYKYHFNAENNSIVNYFTEKITDAILAECVCFYWGCPNISEHIDPRAYIVLPLDDFEMAIYIIKTAIRNNEWEKRIDIIRSEKRRIMTTTNCFRRVEHALKNKM